MSLVLSSTIVAREAKSQGVPASSGDWEVSEGLLGGYEANTVVSTADGIDSVTVYVACEGPGVVRPVIDVGSDTLAGVLPQRDLEGLSTEQMVTALETSPRFSVVFNIDGVESVLHMDYSGSGNSLQFIGFDQAGADLAANLVARLRAGSTLKVSVAGMTWSQQFSLRGASKALDGVLTLCSF